MRLLNPLGIHLKNKVIYQKKEIPIFFVQKMIKTVKLSGITKEKEGPKRSSQFACFAVSIEFNILRFLSLEMARQHVKDLKKCNYQLIRAYASSLISKMKRMRKMRKMTKDLLFNLMSKNLCQKLELICLKSKLNHFLDEANSAIPNYKQ